jgi:hypothetical protein
MLGAPANAQVPRSSPTPLFRVQAGALNPGSLSQVTLAFGAGAGFEWGRHRLVLDATVQSQNRNSGADLTSDARTFLLLHWEYLGRGHGPRQRQIFGRLGGGRVLRSPYKTVWVIDGGVGLRYRMARSLSLIGSLTDAVAFLPAESFVYCPDPFFSCGTLAVKDGPQHNFGFLVGLELHP